MGCRLAGAVGRAFADRTAADEIENFKPEEYWEIKAQVHTTPQAPLFTCALEKIDGKKAKIGQGDLAAAIVAEAKEQTFVVRKVERAEKKRYPAPRSPLRHSSRRRRANCALMWRKRCAWRNLYEGVSVEGRPVGLITYMRTDSTRVAPEIQQKALKTIEERFWPALSSVQRIFINRKAGHKMRMKRFAQPIWN